MFIIGYTSPLLQRYSSAPHRITSLRHFFAVLLCICLAAGVVPAIPSHAQAPGDRPPIEAVRAHHVPLHLSGHPAYDHRFRTPARSEVFARRPAASSFPAAFSRTAPAKAQRYVLLEKVRRTFSSGWENDARWLYSYENGRRSKVHQDEWSVNAWFGVDREFYTAYTPAGKVGSTLYQEKVAGGWADDWRINYDYDGNGNRTLAIQETVNFANEWEASTKYEYTYDTQNRHTKTEIYKWEDGAWKPDVRVTHTYDGPSGQLSQSQSEYRPLDEAHWVKFVRVTYSYDAEERVDREYVETWNKDVGAWEPWYRFKDYVYDSSDRVTQLVEEVHKDRSLQWERDFRHNHTYDEQGNETYRLYESWEGSSWQSSEDVTFTYGYVPLPVELAGFGVRQSGGRVRLTWRTLSETDNAGFDVQRRVADDTAFESIGFVEGHGTTQQPQRYSLVDDRYPPTARRLVYRLRQVDTDGTATLSEPVSVKLAADRLSLRPVAPNPVRYSASLQFSLPRTMHVRIDVVDVLGRRVRTIVDRRLPAGRNEASVDTGFLSAGTYFVRLWAGSQTRIRRIVRVP